MILYYFIIIFFFFWHLTFFALLFLIYALCCFLYMYVDIILILVIDHESSHSVFLPFTEKRYGIFSSYLIRAFFAPSKNVQIIPSNYLHLLYDKLRKSYSTFI